MPGNYSDVKKRRNTILNRCMNCTNPPRRNSADCEACAAKKAKKDKKRREEKKKAEIRARLLAEEEAGVVTTETRD